MTDPATGRHAGSSVKGSLGPLDRLPAWLRHLVLVTVVPFVAVQAQAVIDAEGVTKVRWGDTLIHGLDVAGLSVAAWFLGVFLTGATKQYGVGKQEG